MERAEPRRGTIHAGTRTQKGLFDRRVIELHRRTVPIYLDTIPNKNAKADKKPSKVRTPCK
jgi:hypothetical protein